MNLTTPGSKYPEDKYRIEDMVGHQTVSNPGLLGRRRAVQAVQAW